MENTAREVPSDQSLLRQDLQHSLIRQSINPLTLSAFQRILLTTDGTVTEILEAYSGESIRVVKLSQNTTLLDKAISPLELAWGNNVLYRDILLQGRMSLTNFLYAESMIALDRLDEGVREGLLKSKKPIGLLILEHRIETFKEILDCGREQAGRLCRHFQIDESTNLISRTYRMISKGQPIMLITEKFPESYFRSWAPSADHQVPTAKVPHNDEKQKIDTETVRKTLERFITTELLAHKQTDGINLDDDLLDGGLVDSVGFFQLLTFIAEQFGVTYRDDELMADNFRTLGTIAKGVVQRHV